MICCKVWSSGKASRILALAIGVRIPVRETRLVSRGGQKLHEQRKVEAYSIAVKLTFLARVRVPVPASVFAFAFLTFETPYSIPVNTRRMSLED